MAKTHILANDDKKYLGAWDLPEKDDLVLTIDSIRWEDVKNPKKNDAVEKKRVMRFKEKKYKPMIVNELNSSSIISSTKVSYMEDMGGLQISLYKIWGKWFGKEQEAIRIRKTKVEKPELTPNHKKWNDVKARVQSKTNPIGLSDLRKYYKVSDANFKLLEE